MESQPISNYAPARERPGCVTAYAVLLSIAAAIAGIGGILGGIFMMSEGRETGVVGLITMICAGGFALLYLVLAQGLWQLKNWARVIVIVFQSLGILSNLLTLCASFSGYSSYQGGSGGTAIGSVVGLAIGSYIVYWFVSNGNYFN